MYKQASARTGGYVRGVCPNSRGVTQAEFIAAQMCKPPKTAEERERKIRSRITLRSF